MDADQEKGPETGAQAGAGAGDAGGLIKKINDGVYAVERALVVGSLLLMSFVVFLDVVHRRFTDPESRFASKIAGLIKLITGDKITWVPDGSGYQSLQEIVPWFVPFFFLLVFFIAIRTASNRPLLPTAANPERLAKGEPMTNGKALVYAALTCVGLWALLRFFFGQPGVNPLECQSYSFACGVFPTGFKWALPMGLVLTIWVGFVGASMATRDNRHLKVEALQRYFPERLQRISGLLSGLLTAAFCFLLAILARRFIGYMYEDYIDSNKLGAMFEGIDVPKFMGFLILPVAYTIMGLRFALNGVLAFQGKLPESGGELGDIDLEGLAEDLARADLERERADQAEPETPPHKESDAPAQAVVEADPSATRNDGPADDEPDDDEPDDDPPPEPHDDGSAAGKEA